MARHDLLNRLSALASHGTTPPEDAGNEVDLRSIERDGRAFEAFAGFARQIRVQDHDAEMVDAPAALLVPLP